MVVGGLLQKAARDLKARLETAGPAALGPQENRVEASYEQPPEIEWDQETFSGDAYPAFSWGVNIVEVEVDTLTYEITPIEIWTAYDIGRAIDTRIVEGQVHGGVVQGLGYATCEAMEFADGRPLQATMTDYVIPGTIDVPPIHVELFDNPYAYGPHGAKGAGEIPLTGVAPALAHAVEEAIGTRVTRIPLTPEYLRTVAGA
jgi:CO/xanthine dehydrogenase Mo-binding subunit